MKKIILALLLVMSVFMVGCNSQGDQLGKVKELEKKVSELEKENSDLKKKLGEDVEVSSDLDDDSKDEKSDKLEEIQIGSMITTDRMEITINKIEFSYDVLPDDTSSFYTHYPAGTGKVYIHIDTDIKNIQKQNLECDDIMSVEANYNNGYTYKSSTVPEDSSTGFTYANITTIKPLETLGVRFLVECPQEVEETDNSLHLIFKIDNKEYKYTIR